MRFAIRLFSIFVVLAGLLTGTGHASDVQGYNPILHVELVDSETGDTKMTSVSLEQLCDLPLEDVRTRTPWTDGPQMFRGVTAQALLDTLGVRTGNIELRAINDYSVTTTVDALRSAGALIAFRQNGDVMRPRDKGPFWVVFDFDNVPALRSETIYALSVWQLDRLRISR